MRSRDCRRGPDGAKAGIVFRAIVGATALGMAGYWALQEAGRAGAPHRRLSPARCSACCSPRAWANVGVDWSANLLNWYQQASTLTLFGGLRGVGTRLTLLLALLGGSLATAAGQHITIDLVTRFLKPKVQAADDARRLGRRVDRSASPPRGASSITSRSRTSAPKPTPRAGQKVATVGHGLGESWFILRKQIALDFKSLPHMLEGRAVRRTGSTGREWNAWLEDAGFVERYGKEKIDAAPHSATTPNARRWS